MCYTGYTRFGFSEETKEENPMKKHWLRGLLLGLSLALLLSGGAALADKEPPDVELAAADVHDVNLVTLYVDDDGGGSSEYGMYWPTTDWEDWMSYGYLIVGNAAYVEHGWGGDWAATPGGGITITEPGVVSDEDGYAQYDDSNGPSPMGLQITQYSCAWQDSPNNDFVLVGYVIENISSGRLSGLWAGHYMDPDVDGTVSGDTTAYNASRQMGFQWDQDFVGLRYVSGGVGTYNNMDCCIGGSDLWPAISNRHMDAPYTGTDIMFTMGAGPFSLNPGETYVLGAAWVAGSSWSDLAYNADRAYEMWFASDGCGIGLGLEEDFVPEPASILLLGSGLAGLAGYATLRWRTRE
jgi:hypothetical protein